MPSFLEDLKSEALLMTEGEFSEEITLVYSVDSAQSPVGTYSFRGIVDDFTIETDNDTGASIVKRKPSLTCQVEKIEADIGMALEQFMYVILHDRGDKEYTIMKPMPDGTSTSILYLFEIKP
jgi:hypothetical protein